MLRVNSGLSRRLSSIDIGWLVALIIPIIAILPTLNPDHIIQTADGPFHVHRMLAVTTLIRAGDLYPRWIPWFHVGFGYPVLNFYAPLATYVGGVLGLVGIGAANAFTLIVAAAWVIGSLGMYALGRRYLNPYAGMLASVLWSYAPSTLQAVWNQGSISQIVAAALLPWLFLTLMGVIEKPNARRAAAFGLSLGLIVLAHQPTLVLAGLLMMVGVPALCLWYGWRRGRLKERILYTAVGMILGAGVAAVFLLPMGLELPNIEASKPAADIPQTLANSTLRADQLFVQPQAPDSSDLNRNLPETVGLVDGILALIGLAALVVQKRYKLALACVAGCAFTLFLVQAVSLPVWLSVGLLAELRFPGRTLHVGRLFFALLGGASLLWIPTRVSVGNGVREGLRSSPTKRRPLGSWVHLRSSVETQRAASLQKTSLQVVIKAMTLALSVVVIIAALPTIYPSRTFVDFSGLRPGDEVRYEVATYSFGGTSYDEFKPIWGSKTPKDVPNIDDVNAHPLRVSVIDRGEKGVTVQQDGDEGADVASDHPFDLSFRQFYFPGWSASVDSTPAETFPEAQFGLVTLHVPAGTHTVTVHRNDTAIEAVSPFITLISLGIVAGLLWKGEKSAEEARSRVSSGVAWALAGGIGGFAILNALYIQPQTGLFRQQSPLEAPAYMQTGVHQTFGDEEELLGYTLHQDTTRAGEAFDVTLYWRALKPLDHSDQPIVQLVNPGVSAAWAVSQSFAISGLPGKRAQTPDYFVSDDHRLQVQADAPPYVGRLLVKLLDPSGQPLRLPNGDDHLVLDGRVRIQGEGQAVPKRLDAALDGKLELWCAAVQQAGDQLQIELHWHVLGALATPNVSLFVHGFDNANQETALYDGPMLKGDYAATDWLPGQNLSESVTLSPPAGLARLAVGLHTADGTRLAAQQNGTPVQDNVLWIPLNGPSCTAS